MSSSNEFFDQMREIKNGIEKQRRQGNEVPDERRRREEILSEMISMAFTEYTWLTYILHV